MGRGSLNPPPPRVKMWVKNTLGGRELKCVSLTNIASISFLADVLQVRETKNLYFAVCRTIKLCFHVKF